jgi:MFS family permease
MSAPAATPRRYGNLVAAIAAIGCCDIAMGLTFQLLPLLMDKRGIPAWIIGANTAMAPIGILLAGPFIPRVVGHYGSRRVNLCVVAAVVAVLLGFKLSPSIWLWFPLRFLFGISAGTLFTISEAWVLTFADDGNRGRVMGLYTTVLAITFSVGPLLLPWTGIDGWTPWLIGTACVAASVIPLAFVDVSDSHFHDKEGGGFLRFISKAPVLLFAVTTATLFDSVFISFFSIFGLRSGLDLAVASSILGVGIIGNALFFYPMGVLADRWSRTGVTVLTAGATVVLCLALPWVIGNWLAWPVTVLLSAAAFGVYVIALATLGDSFKGPDLIAGSAAIAMTWGAGGLIGPPIAGAAIDAFGANAVPVSLAFPYAVLLVGLALTGGRLVRTSGLSPTEQ